MTPSELSQKRKSRGRILRSLRIQLAITKLQLSEKTGLTRPTINRIENGEKSSSIDSEIIYMEALNARYLIDADFKEKEAFHPQAGNLPGQHPPVRS